MGSNKTSHEGTKMNKELIITSTIESRIFTFRGQKVMIDRDLAELYEVETKKLNQAVKRNVARFPMEFMFKLTKNETVELVTNCDRFPTLKHSSSTPYVFTEHGIAMLSSVLNSERAITINIEIIKAFIKLRHYTISQSDTNAQIAELRKLLMLYIEKNDKRVNNIIIALNNLIEQPPKTKKIGFTTGEKSPEYLSSVKTGRRKS